VSISKIGNMHLIEVVDDDKEIYQFPVTAVEDVPRQEWFDLMMECRGYVSVLYTAISGEPVPCPICALGASRILKAGGRALPENAVVKELLDWLDKGAAEAMRFRELLMKNRREG
jgi:hypothetical protein